MRRRALTTALAAVFTFVSMGMTARANDRDACSSDPARVHCLVLELRNPTEERARTVVHRLAASGFSAQATGPVVVMNATEERITRWLRARLVRRTLERSATEGTGCMIVLERYRIPANLRAYVSSIVIGHQVCE